MKPVKLCIAVLSVLALNGCAAFYDRHPTTESGNRSEQDQLFWTDRTWRQSRAKEWREEDRRLSRVRLGEFIR